jgi:hypothetical protein
VSWEKPEERSKSEEAKEKKRDTLQSHVSGEWMRYVGQCVIPVSTLEKANATNVVATISSGFPSPISWAMRVAIM